MVTNNQISQAELSKANNIIARIQDAYRRNVVGQETLGFSMLISLIAGGHILIESVPGLAKTTAAKAIAKAVNGTFSRIQCTPDLLPSDIVGTQILNYDTHKFETKLGPVYANFVLLDEINRSSAKTQSAMLEVMQERQVSIGGLTSKMPAVFIVIATQNPIEQEGTYVLSEAQTDRFLLKEKLLYPSVEQEVGILNLVESGVINEQKPCASLNEILFLQSLCKRVYMDEAIKKYIVDIIYATRMTNMSLPPELARCVELGASTRGAIAFMEAAKATALILGRNYCTPDDVKGIRYQVLRHRIGLNYAAVADNISEETIIDTIVGGVATP